MQPMIPAILSFEGTSLSDDEKRLFKKYNPVGFNLFSRNIKSKTQIKSLLKNIKEILERNDIIFAIDQEGGRVRRLTEPEFRPYLPQYAIGNFYNENKELAVELAKDHAYLISSDLKELGFNMNYAPVLDVDQEYTSTALKSRCFSGDEKTVCILGKTMINEYINNGICPCMKHMPGHGRASVDPHLNLPYIDTKLKDLEKDFYPFQKNCMSPAGMTAHIVIPEIDDINPITQSKKGIDYLIRGILNFDGFLISDALDMKALKGSMEEKVQTSLNAGCDAVCYAQGKFYDLEKICNSAAYLSDKSIERFEKIKTIIKKQKFFDDIDKAAKRYKERIDTVELYDDKYDATEVLNKMSKE